MMKALKSRLPISLFVAVISLSMWGCQSKPIVPAIPKLQAITSISAYYEGPENSNGWFDVPKEHWQTILEALSPAIPDPHPATWVSYGELKLTLKNGDAFCVYLFILDDEQPGAFAMGESHDSRMYFRGGNFSKMKQTLEATVKEGKKAANE